MSRIWNLKVSHNVVMAKDISSYDGWEKWMPGEIRKMGMGSIALVGDFKNGLEIIRYSGSGSIKYRASVKPGWMVVSDRKAYIPFHSEKEKNPIKKILRSRGIPVRLLSFKKKHDLAKYFAKYSIRIMDLVHHPNEGIDLEIESDGDYQLDDINLIGEKPSNQFAMQSCEYSYTITNQKFVVIYATTQNFNGHQRKIIRQIDVWPGV